MAYSWGIQRGVMKRFWRLRLDMIVIVRSGILMTGD
jgi:hypothetical protein